MSGSDQAVAEPQVGVVELAEPDVHICAQRGGGDPAGDWLCAWCLERVAHEADRFVFHGSSEFSFTNPAGVRFDIITFSRTTGCRQSGTPVLDHTWFAGHAWSFCSCGRCGVHLGWYYEGPSRFVGLIRDRIIRAVVVLN